MSVSVCIPTYNQAAFIAKSVLSAFQQTCKPNEIIVSDDCSTDNTLEVLEPLLKEIPQLKILKQASNLGISGNTNASLKNATSEFIVRLDSDDLLLPDYIETLKKLLQKYPNAGYAHSAVKEIDSKGNFKRSRVLARKSEFIEAEESLEMAVKGYRVAANILMFRKEALEEVGFITTKINFAEDYFLSTSMAAAGFGNVYSHKTLCCYRVWNDTGKVRQRRKLDEINGLIYVVNEGIAPAFKNKGWNLNLVNKMRVSKAIEHVNCLGWKVYSEEEKKELKEQIFKLSNNRKVKIYAWIYTHHFGFVPDIYHNLIFKTKSVVKKVLFK